MRVPPVCLLVAADAVNLSPLALLIPPVFDDSRNILFGVSRGTARLTAIGEQIPPLTIVGTSFNDIPKPPFKRLALYPGRGLKPFNHLRIAQTPAKAISAAGASCNKSKNACVARLNFFRRR